MTYIAKTASDHADDEAVNKVNEAHISKAENQFRLIKVWYFFIALSLIVMCLLPFAVPYEQGWHLLWQTLFHYDSTNFEQLTLYYTFLPRLSMTLLVGFAMGVAGCVMQFVLRNPIASPTTLGVASGAELGLILGILLFPNTINIGISIDISPVFSAFMGACFSTLLVFILSAKRGYEPLQMVL